MALATHSNIKISGIASALPKEATNIEQFSNLSITEQKKFVAVTGINTRRQKRKDLAFSKLFSIASKQLLEKLYWKKEDIKFLICITQTPDDAIPGVSFKIKQQLELSEDCINLDVNIGCSGYVYGLYLINSLMQSFPLCKALLCVGDALTGEVDSLDTNTAAIFSDAATVTALEYIDETANMFFNLQSNGNGYEAIQQPKNNSLTMNGLDVFHWSMSKVAPSIKSLLESHEIDKNEIDFVVLHQANKLLNTRIENKLDIPKEKFLRSLEWYGNTSSASITLTIVHHFQNKKIDTSYTFLLAGFGVGFSWASCVIDLKDVLIPEIIEI